VINEAVARGTGIDISRWQHLMDMSKLDDRALKQAALEEPEALTAVFLLHTNGSKYVAPEGGEEGGEDGAELLELMDCSE
jgi:hypothetical protein